LEHEVRSVQPLAAGFAVDGTGSTLEASLVVNATGYFANPYIPEIEGLPETGMQVIHHANYGSAEKLAQRIGDRSRVLVVGGRLSAGELLADLHQAGFVTELSHGRAVDFGHAPSVQRAVAPVYFALEDLRVRRRPLLPGSSARKMDGGQTRRLVTSGKVPLRPAIGHIEKDAVVFTDGSTRPYDAIVFATGYRPSLRHLLGILHPNPETGIPDLQGMESREVPGLFFLGLDGLRNFRSRFIRGIREDASALAGVLGERLV
jgi:putative flavoprotein involved in K+ transport